MRLIIAISSLLLFTTNAEYVSIFTTSPRFWWEKFPNNPLQFNRPVTFQQIGLPVRSMLSEEQYQIEVPLLKGETDLKSRNAKGEAGCIVSDWLKDEGCWGRRNAYLPLKMRATVVAMAPKATFKGWKYYLETPSWNQELAGHHTDQFMIMDETFTITDLDSPNYDHGFYFRPVQGAKYPHNWPRDFTAPTNFVDGFWHFRYELIEQPINAKVSFQFCIWQDSFSREICAPYWGSTLQGAPFESTKGLAPPLPFVAAGCKNDYEDCHKSKCCNSDGFACKQVNKAYAQCRPVEEACPPGEDKKWTCDILQQLPPAIPETTSRETVAGKIANNPDLSMFWKMLELSGMSSVLINKDEKITVFAPSNAAMEKLMADPLTMALINGNSKKMNVLMLQHVFSGEMLETDLQSKTPLTPFLGVPIVRDAKSEAFVFTKAYKKIKPANSKIIQADFLASNGVIHVVDSIIVPELTMGDVAPTVPPTIDRFSECAEDYQSCLDQRCCANPSFACLAKDQYYAQCRPAVDPCPPPEDPSFSCKIVNYFIEDDLLDDALEEGTTTSSPLEEDLIDTVIPILDDEEAAAKKLVEKLPTAGSTKATAGSNKATTLAADKKVDAADKKVDAADKKVDAADKKVDAADKTTLNADKTALNAEKTALKSDAAATGQALRKTTDKSLKEGSSTDKNALLDNGLAKGTTTGLAADAKKGKVVAAGNRASSEGNLGAPALTASNTKKTTKGFSSSSSLASSSPEKIHVTESFASPGTKDKVSSLQGESGVKSRSIFNSNGAMKEAKDSSLSVSSFSNSALIVAFLLQAIFVIC
eukprot:TRINITY_DN422_c0_g1_i7.p1 TRINITY_DN422_c0_g1~~TRINITY_DN422_c0_g1_i7.p1  ORF type:complete len:816 (-),score=140.91 TRINITY_DN422_c0_g1_i7:184-2631(-)